MRRIPAPRLLHRFLHGRAFQRERNPARPTGRRIFVAAERARIARLEARLRRIAETQMLGTPCREHQMPSHLVRKCQMPGR